MLRNLKSTSSLKVPDFWTTDQWPEVMMSWKLFTFNCKIFTKFCNWIKCSPWPIQQWTIVFKSELRYYQFHIEKKIFPNGTNDICRRNRGKMDQKPNSSATICWPSEKSWMNFRLIFRTRYGILELFWEWRYLDNIW